MRDNIAMPVAPVIIVAVGLFLSANLVPANAAELDCGELAGRLKSGDDYQLKLELQSQNIRIEHGDDFCSEPANTWFGRQIILPQAANRETTLPPSALEIPLSEVSASRKPVIGNDALSLPGQKMRQGPLPDLGFDSSMGREAAPLPVQRPVEQPSANETAGKGTAVKETSPTVSRVKITGDAKDVSAGVIAPSLARVDPKTVKPCDRELTNFWQAGEHMVDGQKVKLHGVFTIDINNDGQTDNVGFKIGASGRIGNVLNYFPVTEGRLSAQSVPTLKLDNDDDIHRLCAGNVTFSTMTKKERIKAIESAKRQQKELVAGQKKDEVKGNIEKSTNDGGKTKEDAPNQAAVQKTENLMFWAIIIAIVFFTFGSVGLFFAVRNMKSDKEDDEDEDEQI